jgi:glycerol uptake facilitator-like aquaporin
MKHSLSRRLAAEFLGTAFLVAAVVGSGIMGERLAAGNVAIALLANTIATGAVLVALILAFGLISGAHFNPAVSLTEALDRKLPWLEALPYMLAQIVGGVCGAIAAHRMFRLPTISLSQHARSGPAIAFSEFIATFGLLVVIRGSAQLGLKVVAVAVGAYITAAYWFTASTSFANPAVTIARSLSNTFSGIRPADVPFFLLAQFSGALAAFYLFGWLVPASPAPSRAQNLPNHSSTVDSTSVKPTR